MDGRRNGYSDFLNANNQKSELHGGNQYSSIQREASEIQTPKSTYFLVFSTSISTLLYKTTSTSPSKQSF
jgi:hypothetical protein